MRLKQQAPARLINTPNENTTPKQWLWADDGGWWGGILGPMEEEERGATPVRKQAKRRPTIKTSTCVENMATDASAGALGLCEVVFSSPCSIQLALDNVQVQLLQGGGTACISITATTKPSSSEAEQHVQQQDVQLLVAAPNAACCTSFIRLVDSSKLQLLVAPCDNVAELLSEALAQQNMAQDSSQQVSTAGPTELQLSAQEHGAAQPITHTSYALAATYSAELQSSQQQPVGHAGGSMSGVVRLNQMLPDATHPVVLHNGVDVAAVHARQQLPPFHDLPAPRRAGGAGLYPSDWVAWQASRWLSSRLSAMLLPVSKDDEHLTPASAAGSAAAGDTAAGPPAILLPGGGDGMWRLVIALSPELLPGVHVQAGAQADAEAKDSKESSLHQQQHGTSIVKQEASADGQPTVQGSDEEAKEQGKEVDPEDEGRRGWQDDLLLVLRWLLPQYAHQLHGYYSENSSSNPLFSTQCPAEHLHRHTGFSAARLYKAVKPQGIEPQYLGTLPQLVPVLRPYQKRAVAWMLSRELCQHDKCCNDTGTAPQQAALHPLWRRFVSLSGQQVYLNPFAGLLRHTAPAPPTDGIHAVKGGILCDEMGLGKTVELLACILAHPLTPVTAAATADNQQLDLDSDKLTGKEQQQDEQGAGSDHTAVGHEHFEGTGAGRAGKRRYKAGLLAAAPEDGPARKVRRLGALAHALAQQHQTQHKLRPAEYIDCPCGFRSDDPSDDGDYTGLWVMCDKCCAWMHGACVGLKRAPVGAYVCSRCKRATAMQQVDSICGTTLILCPAPILAQWWDEIAKHTQPGAVRVVVYMGQQQNAAMPAADAWATPVAGGAGDQTGLASSRLSSSAAQVWSAADLAAADIVLTTYDALKRDVDRQPDLQVTGKQLRQQKRYQVVPTPLSRLTWWRVVLDEAQMVESSTAKAAAMALKLRAVHRWCVTGTPISRGLEDVYGLMAFLQAAPWRSELWWRRAIQRPAEAGCPHANARLLCCLRPALGGIMWRTAKQDVLDQLGIPPQHHHATWLFQSPVERHFYVRQHQECATRVRNVLPARLLTAAARAARQHAAAAAAQLLQSSIPDAASPTQQPSSRNTADVHEVPTGDLTPVGQGTTAAPAAHSHKNTLTGSTLGRYELEQLNRPLTQLEQKRVLHPLLRLRQAACHPQVGAGGIKSISAQRAPMTMDEILQVLVTKAKVEAEEAQRKLMVALNGLAALMLLEQGDAGRPAAIATYREALHYMTKHKEDVRTDPLVQLHTFHNLHQLLSPSPPAGVPRTLRDSTLQAEADVLRCKYLEQRINQLAAQQADYDKAVRNSTPFDQHHSWFLTAIDMLRDNADEMTLVDNAKRMLLEQDTLADKKYGVNASSLSHRFRSLTQLKVLLVDALDGVEKTRKPAMAKLQELCEATSQADPAFVEQAGHCHRCREHLQRVGRLCEHCVLEELLVKWEVRLFALHSKALVAGQRVTAEEAASWAASAALRRVGKGGLGEEGPAALQQLQQLMGMDGDAEDDATAGASVGAAAVAGAGSSRRDEAQVAGAQIQWKPSEAELLLKFLASQLRQHCGHTGTGSSSNGAGVSVATVLAQAKEHLEKLEAQRKLFAQARALSLAQRWLLYAHDELDMALARTRLRAEDEYVAEYEAAFKIQAAEIPIRNKELSDDKILALGDLNRTLGTLRYLRMLQASRQPPAAAAHAATPAIDLTMQADVNVINCSMQPNEAGAITAQGTSASEPHANMHYMPEQQQQQQQVPEPHATSAVQGTALVTAGTSQPSVPATSVRSSNGADAAQVVVRPSMQGPAEPDDVQPAQHICPICHDPITSQFSMMPCGHMVCLDCMEMLVGGKNSAQQLLLHRAAGNTERRVQCPTCRRRTPLTEIAYVDGGTTSSRTINSNGAGISSGKGLGSRSLTVHTQAEGMAALLGLSLQVSPGKSSPQQQSPTQHMAARQGALANDAAAGELDGAPQQEDAMPAEHNLWEGEADVVVSGSYGTKVEAVVRRIMYIAQKEHDAKIIVFSAWLDLLELLAHALSANKVPHALAKARKGFQAALAAFKTKGSAAVSATAKHDVEPDARLQEGDARQEPGIASRDTSPCPAAAEAEDRKATCAPDAEQGTDADGDIVMADMQPLQQGGQVAGSQPQEQAAGRSKGRRGRRASRTPTPPASTAATAKQLGSSSRTAVAPRVLLLLMSQGGAGLNLTEAQHVVLVEPRTDPAPELQAIGRIHRIGQTRETHVHRFIMCHTVEENVYALGASYATDMDMGHGASSNSDATAKAGGKESIMRVCDVAMLLETPWEATGHQAANEQATADAAGADDEVTEAAVHAPANAVDDPVIARRAAAAAAAEARWQQQQQEQQHQDNL